MSASSMETPSGDRTALNDFRSFKPMYTLQPVKATREKQLKQWSNIIMKFCRDNKVSSINPADFSLFRNPTIDRNLSQEAVTAVVESMIKAGNAEWENGPSHKILRIILKAPEVLANEIYAWASLNVLIGSVATIYELYAGEDKDTAFYGTDVALIMKALSILEATGKCVVLRGATRDEDGVKFLA